MEGPERCTAREGASSNEECPLQLLGSVKLKGDTVRRLAVAENMQEGTVAFLWQFSLQNEVGLQMYADFARLCHCGSTLVSGIEVRRERSSRSQLANLISKMLYNN